MAILLLPFLVLALVGLVLSFVVHLCAWFGWPQPLGQQTMLLHVVAMVVWLPTIVAAMRLVRGRPPREFLRSIFRGCPGWMLWLTALLFVYAGVNLVVFVLMGPGVPVAKTSEPPGMLRGFSGHWMLFDWVAFAILYSSLAVGRREKVGREQPPSESATAQESEHVSHD